MEVLVKSFYLITHNIRCYPGQNHLVQHNKLYFNKVLRFSFHVNGQTLDCHPHQGILKKAQHIVYVDGRCKLKMRSEWVLSMGVKVEIPSYRVANSTICIHMIAHMYVWLHNKQHLITTVFVKYNGTRLRWSILTYPHNF